MNGLRVYWRPGCSSCVKVKEFLTNLGVEYESVNVSARPEAMEELRALGVRTVPVVARGSEYVFAQELADVSAFIGRKVDFERLARWWRRDGDGVAQAKVETYYGDQLLHHVMERCTWHSAQHARQIMALLERFGIAPDGPLTAADYAGLPMPAALWE